MSTQHDNAADTEDNSEDRMPSTSTRNTPRHRSHRLSPSGIFSPNVVRRVGTGVVVIIGLFVFGAFLLLATIQSYFRISEDAYLTEVEIPWQDGADKIQTLRSLSASAETEYGDDGQDRGEWGPDGEGSGGYWMQKDWAGKVREVDSWDRLYDVTPLAGERIPRLIHQTWKNDVLPDKWQRIWRECREGMPDYEYMLWTDDLSRKFIHRHYPSFLAMFDGYKYPIQRADAIRYFILHHFGGIYMDLDIGCQRRMDPLLGGTWDVILPRTKPVGVSNDLIFSSRGNAFMERTIHGLPTFDHSWIINYPTVMFSTGPMFLSAQYGLYKAEHPISLIHPDAEVRIMPKSLYGKNAKPGEAPHSFFSHWYGSSWHADDAGFIDFLGTKGKYLMYAGMLLVSLIALRAILDRIIPASNKGGLRSLLGRGGGTGRGQYRMVSLANGRQEGGDTEIGSPITSEGESDSSIADFARRAGHIILAAPATLLPSSRSRGKGSGILYFLPAFFSPSEPPAPKRRRPRTASEASDLPPHRRPGRMMRGPSRHGSLSMLSPVIDGPETEFEEEPSSSKSSRSTFAKPLREGKPPPPYAGSKDEAMDEVDAFLQDEA